MRKRGQARQEAYRRQPVRQPLCVGSAYSAAAGPSYAASYHWHLEICPRTRFELSSGLFVNTVSPEEAAEKLRAGKLGYSSLGLSALPTDRAQDFPRRFRSQAVAGPARDLLGRARYGAFTWSS